MKQPLKYFIIGVAFFFLHYNSIGQSTLIDSLKLALKNANHDTIRCKILNDLTEAEPDDNIWPQYNNQLLKLSEKCASSTSNKQLKKFYLIMVAGALYNIGWLANVQGDIPKALEFYHKSLKIREDVDNKIGIAGSLNNIGAIYNNQGDIPKALDYYHRSLKIQEEINDKKGAANSLNNIGFIYSSLGDNVKALDYFSRSFKIQEEVNDKQGMAYSLNNLGTIYKKQNNITKAFDLYQRSLKLQEEINNKQGLASPLNNLAEIYNKQGDYTTALEYFNRALRIQEELNNKNGKAISLSKISNMLFKQGKINEALHYAQLSLQASKELGYPGNIKNAAASLKMVYQHQHKFKEAFEMYELEIKMRDSVTNLEAKKSSIKKEFQYLYDKKVAADSVKTTEEKKVSNAKLAESAAKLKAEATQRYALYGGLILLLIFAGFMVNRFRVTNQQKKIITQQKIIVEEKHKEITDSINYAERIQRSFLASATFLDNNLKDYFILFQPKDVVSGDFYWASKLSNNQFALATADSTGHGVPGAIMSLLNITSLEKAIETESEPSSILNTTRKIIIDRLKKDGSAEGGKDGMDCSLCIFDFKNRKLVVSAANNPIWIIRGTDTIEIKPDKMPVGKHDRDTTSFTQQEIDLQKGDVIFTLTDGFPDQFGGSIGKKFMSKNLRELLAKNAHLPMQEQKVILETTFKEWVGNLEQVDDITIIGVRI